MKKNLLEKIIKLIKEQPTNATGPSVPGTGDDSSTVIVKKKKRYIWTRGIRKNWKPKNES